MYIVYTVILYTQVHYIHRYIVHLPNEGRNEIYLDWHCEINK